MPTREFAGGSRVTCDDEQRWGERVQIGPDVIVECERLCVGSDVRIGTLDREDSFRYPGGVRIRATELVLDDGVSVDRHVLIRGGRIVLGRHVRIHSDATIHVVKRLAIGAGGSVGRQCEIAGEDVVTGRRFWMLPQAKIGGGSALEAHSCLRAGDWFHLGARCLVNTARPVTIGDEVGLGTGTSLYTHGAYASALDGKPVAYGPISIGDRTWIPGAIVNPSVRIGKDCVIGVGSVVTRDIPDGSLAAGVPAKVIRENAYPAPLTGAKRFAFLLDFMQGLCAICRDGSDVTLEVRGTAIASTIGETHVGYYPEFSSQELAACAAMDRIVVLTDQLGLEAGALPPHVTIVDLVGKRVVGAATPLTERVLNQLRRYGVRYNYDAEDGRYAPWR